MEIAVVVVSILCVILLCIVCLQKKEVRSLTKQLKKIDSSVSNEQLHSKNGFVSKELINEINSLIEQLRKSEIHFQKRQNEIELMLTNISHDLRTPLTSALGYLDMLSSMNMPEEEKEATLAIVHKRMIRLKELIDAFFEFSCVITRGEAPEMSELNLLSCIEESIANYYDDYSDRGRMIDFKCNVNKIKVISNRNLLMRIFDNLIGNALKHGLGDLSVNIVKESDIKITFANRIEDDNLEVERLFDEFYTTDISRTKGSTGLGLAIAKQFTNILGGDIKAVKDGNSLRFEITM